VKTRNLAINTLEATHGIEIYVVAFGVCRSGTASINNATYTSAQCNASSSGGQIGASTPSSVSREDVADQRMLKCIASSTPGTNDHYFWVQEAEDLPQVFQEIANAIAFRLIE
jgi:hypothetical protein